MGTTLTLKETKSIIESVMETIGSVQKELDEISLEMNSHFVNTIQAHYDDAMEAYALEFMRNMEEVDKSLRDMIEKRREAELGNLQVRKEDLQENLVSTTRKRDELEARISEETALYRQSNPEYDRREEHWKKEVARLAQEVKILREEVDQTGGLRYLFHLFSARGKRASLAKKVIALGKARASLNEVRVLWQERAKSFAETSKTLQDNWTYLATEISNTKQQLDYLSRHIHSRATRDAIRKLFEENKLPRGTIPAYRNLEKAVANRDNYQEAIKHLAEIMALLKGVRDGFDSFRKSLTALIEEEVTHSAHLKRLQVKMPHLLEEFRDIFPKLREKLIDEKETARHPLDFSRTIKEETEGHLREQSIRDVFESLGAALTSATAAWKS